MQLLTFFCEKENFPTFKRLARTSFYKINLICLYSYKSLSAYKFSSYVIIQRVPGRSVVAEGFPCKNKTTHS